MERLDTLQQNTVHATTSYQTFNHFHNASSFAPRVYPSTTFPSYHPLHSSSPKQPLLVSRLPIYLTHQLSILIYHFPLPFSVHDLYPFLLYCNNIARYVTKKDSTVPTSSSVKNLPGSLESSTTLPSAYHPRRSPFTSSMVLLGSYPSPSTAWLHSKQSSLRFNFLSPYK